MIQLIVNDSTVDSAADLVTVTANTTPADWYTIDGDTYIVGDSSVTVDPSLFAITVNTVNDSVVFEANGSDPKIFIRLMSNGEIFTGYIEGSDENPTINSEFAAGTKVTVAADGRLMIETPLIADLTFGGK